MNKHKLQVLIAAGVFSAALLNGAAYAEDKEADDSQVQTSNATDNESGKVEKIAGPHPANQKAKKAKKAKKTEESKTETKEKTSEKSGAQSGCAGKDGCGGH